MSTAVAATAPPPAGRRRSLVGQSGLTSMAAALGLLSGLAVDAVLAVTFGAGLETDAFFVGARVPLALTTIVLIAANQTLVPVIAAWLVTDGHRATGVLSSGLCAIGLGCGALLGLALALVSEPLALVLAPGLSDRATELAGQVLRVMALTLPFTVLAEVLRAHLNAQRSFVTPALVNVALNVTVIAVLLLVQDAGVVAVAWGYVAGNVLRTVVLLVMSLRRGLVLNPVPGLRSRASWSAAGLCTRPLAGAGLAPLVRLVEQGVVSLLPTGSVSLLNYGYRLVSGVAGAVFFRSIIVTLVPRLTQAVARGQVELARGLTALGLRLMLVVALPLAAFTAVLAEPAVRLLFDRGRFDSADAGLLGLLLTLFALSMPPDGIVRAQQAPYFSSHDTRTPLRNSVFGMVVNLALLPVALLPDDRTTALCLVVLAFVVSRWATVVHAQVHLRRDGLAGDAGVRPTLTLLLPPLTLGCAVAAGLAVALDLHAADPGVRLAGLLLLTASAGAAAFALPLVLQRRRLRRLLRAPADAAPGPSLPVSTGGPA